MSFSNPVEQLCVARQTHFKEALIGGLPLRPVIDNWTIGDLVFLSAQLNVMVRMMGDTTEEDFSRPVSEWFDFMPQEVQP